MPSDAVDFRPLIVNALYTGIERGLVADVLAARALGTSAQPVCTSHVVASHDVVTDVLEVPTDTVDAQLHHLLHAIPESERPTAARIGIVGHPATVQSVFRHAREMEGYLILDLTLSGPSGEDIVGSRGLDALREEMQYADLVTVRRRDAELLCGMEITSLDDAQVAVQRLHHQGGHNVLLRCGALRARHFNREEDTAPFYVDLLYHDGEFSLFEAPVINSEGLHGASSALSLALLAGLNRGDSLVEAVQSAKRFATDALHLTSSSRSNSGLVYPSANSAAAATHDE